MFKTINQNMIPMYALLFSLWISNIILISAQKHHGKAVTQGKMCKDLSFDDDSSEYFDVGKDVDVPVVYHYPRRNDSKIPYPHTLRIVVPLGEVITLDAFTAMAVDETGLPTGRFHTCTPIGSDYNAIHPFISSHKCTIGDMNWESTYMGYQFPLRVISTEKYKKAIEFLWTWVKDRHAPMLIQFRFIGIQMTTEDSGAKLYGVLVSPVVETTELFQTTKPIEPQDLKKLQCFDYEQLKGEVEDGKPGSSDYFTFADGFPPQVEIPFKPEYLELLENKDSINETVSTAASLTEIITTTSLPTTERTTFKPKKKQWVIVNNQLVAKDMSESSTENGVTSNNLQASNLHDEAKETALQITTNSDPVTTLSILDENIVKSRNSSDAFDKLEDAERTHRQTKESVNTQTEIVQIENETMIEDEDDLDDTTDIEILTKFPETNEGLIHLDVIGKPTILYKTWYGLLHSTLMLFVWIVCIPNSIFIARYFKESYFNEYLRNSPSWLMIHVASMIFTCILMAISTVIAFSDLKTKYTHGSPMSKEMFIHILLGVACISIFVLLMITGWFKFQEDTTLQLLNRSIHFLLGNVAYIFALILVWRTPYIGMPCATWIITLFWIIWSIATNMAMSNHFYWQDTTMELKHRNRAFKPLPIERIVFGEPPGTEMKERIFVWHLGGSLLVFALICMMHVIKDDTCGNCQFEFFLGCKMQNAEDIPDTLEGPNTTISHVTLEIKNIL